MADEIAGGWESLRIPITALRPVFCTLLQATANGHTYLPQTELFAQASELFKVEPSAMEASDGYADEPQGGGKTVCPGALVYSSHYYYLELNAARMLHDPGY